MSTKTMYDVLNKKGQTIMRLDDEAKASEAAEFIGGSFKEEVVEIPVRETSFSQGTLPTEAPAAPAPTRRYEVVPNGFGGTTTKVVKAGGNTASDKQMTFLKKLLDERKGTQVYDDTRAALNSAWKAGALSKSVASAAIDQLLKSPKPQASTTAAAETSNSSGRDIPDVPAGRYAFTNDDGNTAFCEVSRPEQGKWAGYTFTDLLLGSSGDLRREKIPFPAQVGILRKIEKAGIKESLLRFGHELGQCGACHSPLTDPKSIAAGIGPVCANKRGW